MKTRLAKYIRRSILVFGHAVMVIASFNLAVELRFDGHPSSDASAFLGTIALPLIIIKLSAFGTLRLFSGWWRYVSLPDLVNLLKANTLGSILVITYAYLINDVYHLPWTVYILDGMLCFLLMSGARVIVRIASEAICSASKTDSKDLTRVLIVGAGAAGQSVVREASQNPKLNWKIVGFIDQDSDRQKQRFQGVPVIGMLDDLQKIIHFQSINLVLLANPSLCLKKLREIISLCQKSGVNAKILPNVGEILNGGVSIQHARDVQLEDLLGRPPVRLNIPEITKCISGRRILVTGAAGSIGREICRQVAKMGASTVILFDNAETPLFHLERDLMEEFPGVEFIPTLSDVRDSARVSFVFQHYSPEVVFHAAAYKHVPMSEKNPMAAIENNTLGTRILVDAANQHEVDRFVMVSTDKAVNPTNIMGASKRAAEIYAQASARNSRTKIVTVRFGNVLGSNGSVVPIFQKQIREGGPVTVTDRYATRFFMTIPEAVQLVLQAGSMGEGGEIFILNMGEQVPIVRLAEELIILSGMKPYDDIDIIFTGLRPGEKLHEELLLDEEGVLPTAHEKICVAASAWHNLSRLNELLSQMDLACRAMDTIKVVALLKELVPQYRSGEPAGLVMPLNQSLAQVNWRGVAYQKYKIKGPLIGTAKIA